MLFCVCHSKEQSDVGIHNLLVANSQKSVKIVRFGNRLPRQSADWLAMTGFFDSLKESPKGLSFLYGIEIDVCRGGRLCPPGWMTRMLGRRSVGEGLLPLPYG